MRDKKQVDEGQGRVDEGQETRVDEGQKTSA